MSLLIEFHALTTISQISDAAYNRERLMLYRFGNLVRPIIGSGFYFGFYGRFFKIESVLSKVP